MNFRTLTLAAGLVVAGGMIGLRAQNPPQAINYQAVARDAGGNLITTPLTVRMSIRQGSSTGTVVYQETHNVTPNTYGLFNLAIGQGAPQSGSFSGIDWSAGPYFVQVELNSGSGYVNMGTQQMLSVPYALYSGKSNMALNDLTDVNTGGVATGQVLKWNGTSWVPAGDENTDAQTLTLSGSTLSISGGNSVTLPPGADNWGTQVVQTTAVLSGDGTSGNPLTIAQQGATSGQVLKWNGTSWAPANDIGGGAGDNWGTQVVQTTARLTGNGTSGSPLDIAQQGATNGQVLKWNGTSWAPANDNNTTYTAGSGISISGTTISATDASTTNEIQTLSLSGSTLSISGGNSVTLPPGADNWGTQVAQTSARLTGNGTSANPLDLAQQGATSGQVLKWNGTSWAPANDQDNDGQTLSFNSGTGVLSISGGNSVTLPMSSGGDNWGSQVVQTTAVLSGNGTSGNPLTIAQQGATTGQVLKWNGTSWAPANDIGGGAGDNWGTQVVQTNATLSGNGTSGNPLGIAQQGATNGQVLKWNGTTWAPAADNNTTYTAGSGISISGTTISAADVSATNEIQTLSLSGTTLSISGGNSVTLPTAAGDNWGTQVVQTNATLSGNGTSGNPLGIAQQGATSGQVLKWNGTSWAPANDNNTTYTAGSGISISGTTLSLSSGGGSVDLSPVTANAWQLGGNSVTASNFIGTTNTEPLRFRAHNQKAGHVGLPGDGSTFLGYQAGNSDDGSDNQNTFIGYQTGFTTSNSVNNVGVGYRALYSNTLGPENIAIGGGTLYSNTTGGYNTATGSTALYSNTTGSYNVATGSWALYSNTTGHFNVALGAEALIYNTSGAKNVAIGSGALLSNTTGFSNVAVGASSLFSNTDRSNLVAVGDSALYNNGIGASSSWHATDNVAVGSKALYANTTGYENTATGSGALYYNTTGNRNTATGRGALYSNTTGYENTATGSGALYYNTTGNRNTATGKNALNANTTGYDNTATGKNALYVNTTGYDNTATGSSALAFNTTGNRNTATGKNALNANTTGYENTATGSDALFSNTIGNWNTATGRSALYSNTTGFGNVAVGVAALRQNTMRSNLVAVGDSALYNNGIGASSSWHATDNVAVGSKALYANTTGSANTATGFRALYSNTTGDDNTATGRGALYSNTTGYNNTATGRGALYSNTTGYDNTATGRSALYSNTTGNWNTATGRNALYSNTTGNWNTATGRSALSSNNTGYENTATGSGALYGNTTGFYNTATGSEALYSNTTGNRNTATGRRALHFNTTGDGNTAAGTNALHYNTTQHNATAFGYSAGDTYTSSNSSFLGAFAYPNAGGYSNIAGLGYEARPTASNQVRVGNSSVTSIGGYANWTNVSDGRFKKDVQANVPGLEFIMKLRPVTYHMDVTGLARYLGEGEFAPNRREEPDATTLEIDRQSRAEKETILYTGFIAQEVEKAARELGYDFSGVDKPQNEKSLYGLRYAEFVVPLVKAIQEQQKIIEEQRSRIDTLEKELMQVKMQLEASALKTK